MRHVVKDDLIWDKDKHRSDPVLFYSVKFSDKSAPWSRVGINASGRDRRRITVVGRRVC